MNNNKKSKTRYEVKVIHQQVMPPNPGNPGSACGERMQVLFACMGLPSIPGQLQKPPGP